MLLCIIQADNSRGTSNPLRKVDGKLGVSTASCRGQAEPHPGGRKYFSLTLTSSGPLVSPKLYDKKNNNLKKWILNQAWLLPAKCQPQDFKVCGGPLGGRVKLGGWWPHGSS